MSFIVIPFRIVSSQAEFCLLKNPSIGKTRFITVCARDINDAKHKIVNTYRVTPLRFVDLDKAFAFECLQDMCPRGCVWLDYERALNSLCDQSHKKALTELFYKPEPL